MTDMAVHTGRLEDVVAAVAVLLAPDGPGEPWTVEEIAASLPDIAEAGGGDSLQVAAATARWLCAAAAGGLSVESGEVSG